MPWSYSDKIRMNIVRELSVIFPLFLVFLLAWKIQSCLFLNWDVSWLMLSTQRFISGGTYSHDFFSPSPPMILYLYLPVVMVNKLVDLNLVVTFKVYILLLISLSLFLSYQFLRRICFDNGWDARSIIVYFALALLLIPMYEFGQRDHIMAILSLPYLMLIVFRLQGYQPSSVSAILVGILSGIGFSIKPQFLLIPAFIELYYMYEKKNFFAWTRTEVFMIASVVVLYLGTMFEFNRDYLTNVAPFLLRNYYSTIALPWKAMLFNSYILYCWFPIIFYLILYKDRPYGQLAKVLCLGLIAMLVVLYQQRTSYYYHIVPSLSLAVVLQMLLFDWFIRIKKIERTQAILISVSMILMLFFIKKYYLFAGLMVFHETEFFVFSGFLYFLLLYSVQRKKNILKTAFATGLILILGHAGRFLSRSTSFYPHSSAITILLMLALYIVIATRENNSAGKNLFIAVVTILYFAVPFALFLDIYHGNVYRKDVVIQPFINFFEKTVKNQTFAIYSPEMDFAFPAINYTNARLAQRFDCLWMVSSLVRNQHWMMGSYDISTLSKNDARFIENMLLEDISLRKPKFILIDATDRRTYLPTKIAYDIILLRDRSDIKKNVLKKPTIIVVGNKNNRTGYLIIDNELSEPAQITLSANILHKLDNLPFGRVLHHSDNSSWGKEIKKVMLGKQFYMRPSFDFLAYFANNSQFIREWKSYRYLTTFTKNSIFTSKPMYTVLVYRRID